MLVLLLVNLVPARLRAVLGVAFALAGVVLAAVSAMSAAGLAVPAGTLAAVGVALAVSGLLARRRAARTAAKRVDRASTGTEAA